MADRIAIELEVRVQGTPPLTCFTGEIGPGGLWLRSGDVPATDQLVTLAVIDPAIGQLTVKGLVGQPAPGRVGVEVALFDNPPEKERRWRRLLERMAREAHLRPAMAEAMPAGIPPTGPVPEPNNVVRMRTGPLPFTPQPAPQAEDAPPRTDNFHFTTGRAHQRRTSNIRVAVRLSDGSTASAVARDLSEGGAFLSGAHLPSVGESLDVRFSHPVTGDAVELPATVVRSVTHGEHPGVGIRFMDDAGAHVPWAVFGGRLSNTKGMTDRRDRSEAGASDPGKNSDRET